MKILLVNDDGIDAAGIKVLEKFLIPKHDILVVAPERQRTGCSSSINFTDDVVFRKIDDCHYACSGTPVDCCQRPLLGAFDFFPDLVISGINSGPNVGTDVIYSGTTGGARQAAFMGFPAMAVSVNAFHEPFHYENGGRFIATHMEELMQLMKKDYYLNINIPAAENIMEYQLTSLAKIHYSNRVENRWEKNLLHTRLAITESRECVEPGTDAFVVNHGKISVSRVYIYAVSDISYIK